MDTSKERLAIFLPGLYDGGAERILLNLAQAIADRGVSVDLVLSRAEGPFLADIPGSVRLIDLKSSRVLMCMPALVHYLRSERPAVLLSALYANIIALWARRSVGIPQRLVISEHNTLTRVSQGEKDLRWRVYPELAKWFYPWADGIIAVSDGVASDLRAAANLQKDRIQVIYNPIVTPELKQKAEPLPEHPWFGTGQPPVVLGVGRLTAQKAFEVLIESFARVRKAWQARLLILGEGEERPKLEALVRKLGLVDDVELPGFVSNPYSYMRHAALFVLSSRWEGLPTVLVESMCLGTPVIATDCPSGPREILKNGQYGQLVPVENVSALALAIQNSLAHGATCPPDESWKPFELDFVTDQYIDMLLGSCTGVKR
jgi:glycosyltransferase involved in cell wall biosynthesis